MEFPVSKFTTPLLKPASIILFAAVLCSCQYNQTGSYINEEASISIPGMPFKMEQAFFVNQYASPSSRTTSWVLADSGFINDQSIASFFKMRGKDKLCILHWSQTDDPVWIGARIAGRFLWADLMMYESDTLVIKQYRPNGVVTIATAQYKKEIEGLLQELDAVRYP